jgi:hypothetical protein
MIDVAGLMDRLAADLADPGHVAWPWPQLAGYLREGAAVVIRLKPDAFVRERVLRLEGGEGWHPICDCERLTKEAVIGQCDSAGVVFKRLPPVSESALWPGADLPPRADRRPFRLREFSLADDGLRLRVYPRIPPGVTAYVLVRCPVMPDFMDPGQPIDDSLAAALVQWAMYRALLVDGERGPSVAAAAESHRDVFNTLVGAPQPPRRGKADAG